MKNSNTLPTIEVGDTVIFRTDLKVGKRYGQIGYLDGMLQGKQVVEKVYDTGNFDVIGSIYFMSPEMVAQVIKPTKERVYTEQEMKKAIEMAREGNHLGFHYDSSEEIIGEINKKKK